MAKSSRVAYSAFTFAANLAFFLETVFFFKTPLVTALSNSLYATDNAAFAVSASLASIATNTFLTIVLTLDLIAWFLSLFLSPISTLFG